MIDGSGPAGPGEASPLVFMSGCPNSPNSKTRLPQQPLCSSTYQLIDLGPLTTEFQ